jgi:hypothetical protein
MEQSILAQEVDGWMKISFGSSIGESSVLNPLGTHQTKSKSMAHPFPCGESTELCSTTQRKKMKFSWLQSVILKKKKKGRFWKRKGKIIEIRKRGNVFISFEECVKSENNSSLSPARLRNNNKLKQKKKELTRKAFVLVSD